MSPIPEDDVAGPPHPAGALPTGASAYPAGITLRAGPGGSGGLGAIGVPESMVADAEGRFAQAVARGSARGVSPAASQRRRPSRSFAIAFTMRSGSTLLCEWLASLEVGRPIEYLNTGPGNMVESLSAAYGTTTVAEYVAAVVGERQSADGTFGLKVGFRQLIPLVSARLVRHLGDDVRWVYLTREDLLGQAISLVRATQTWQWTSLMEPRGAPRYDESAIVGALHDITTMMGFWERWFAAQGVSPLRVSYERLIEAPQATVAEVVGYLGVERSGLDRLNASVTRQRDSLSDEWAGRFRRSWAAGDPR